MLKKVIGLFVWIVIVDSAASQCRDEQDRPVEWFFAIREPHTRKYIFFDQSSSEFRQVEDEAFLAFLFRDISPKKDSLLLWNDQPAEVDGLSKLSSINNKGLKAHDKGILFKNSKNSRGFFLLHSIPKFPDIQKDSINPETPQSSSFGQSMICLSTTTTKSYSTIWKHLNSQNALVYHDSFSFPVPKKTGKEIETSFIEGATFRLVTKSSQSKKPPFEGVLAPLFKTGWLVESWGRPYAENTYKPYRVINNEEVTFESSVYKSTSDHSKFAVSIDLPDLVCVGGMNHMDSQANRGGSFVCFSHATLHDQLLNQVLTSSPERS